MKNDGRRRCLTAEPSFGRQVSERRAQRSTRALLDDLIQANNIQPRLGHAVNLAVDGTSPCSWSAWPLAIDANDRIHTFVLQGMMTSAPPCSEAA